MKSVVLKHAIAINGHKTSITLEDEFWTALQEIAVERKLTRSALVSIIDRERGDVGNLSSALRLFVLRRYRSAAGSAGSQQPAASNQKKALVTA